MATSGRHDTEEVFALQELQVFIVDSPLPQAIHDELAKAGVKLEVTGPSTAELVEGGQYKVRGDLLKLARGAEPEYYGAGIIGHNRGTGERYAEALPPGLRDRTLVVFDTHVDAEPYLKLGYRNFATRFGSDDSMLQVAEFLVRMARVNEPEPAPAEG